LDGGSARRKAAAYTQNNTNRINPHRHPWLELDSNPRHQRSKTGRGLDRAVVNSDRQFPSPGKVKSMFLISEALCHGDVGGGVDV
jgi:hypothetical protein